MAFVINVTKWLLWTVETMYFDVVEPVFYIYSISPCNFRFSWYEASLCEDLLPGRWSTVTKSSLGSISWATVLISSHLMMCKTQMWPVNTPSKHETLTQCWSNSGPPSATLAQHKTSTGVYWAAGWQCKPTPNRYLVNVGPAPPVLWTKAGLMLARRLWRWPTFSVASNTAW